ncbi:MAG: hypothetical protein II832_02290 [Synergistaceae bacterium]|nr:hypothetical protein [Synergistaceae bacterium]
MNSKEIAELAVQIVVAVIGSGKYDCADSEKVCGLYSAVVSQVQEVYLDSKMKRFSVIYCYGKHI